MARLSEEAELGDRRVGVVCAHARFNSASAGIRVVADGVGVHRCDGVERNRDTAAFVASAIPVSAMWRGFYAQGAVGEQRVGAKVPEL